MTRLRHLFGKKQSDLLAVYFTAGHPRPETFADTVTSLAAGGADIIEIGVPFSDPLADGPVIQASSNTAIRNGMTLSRILDEVERVRPMVPDTPLVLMGYLNPMYHYGMERFMERCAAAGVDGLIIPDLPLEEYTGVYRDMAARCGLPVILLITPGTDDARIRYIDSISGDGAFIYMVSANGTTGGSAAWGDDRSAYFSHVASLGLEHPVMTGFGIHDAATLKAAGAHSAGGIVGTAFIRALETNHTPALAVQALMKQLGR